jgi:MFS family permease
VLPTKAAYLYSGCAFAQGLSSFFWAPMIAKYGKRPVYVSSFVLYAAVTLGCGACKTWNAQLGLRILAGIAAGAGEILGPSVISDIWFVHERGLAMGMFSSFLSIGVAFGLVLAGQITQFVGWRSIYWIFGGMIGGSAILIVFTFPETTFQRPPLAPVEQGYRPKIDQSKRHGFLRKMALTSGVHTQESFWQLFVRPFIVVVYPAVGWATAVTAVTVGFLIAVTTNVAIAFGQAYHFGPSKVGLCFLSGIVGSILAIIFGGTIIDKASSRMAKKNGGIREPEMRLPAIIIVIITAPLALILYGVGIQHQLHWIVPTIGLGLINFSIVVGSNIGIVYAIDCYKPITAEVVTAILAYKSVLGFILSFYTNQWVMGEGYQHAFGEMAGISAAFLVLAIPLYIWGKNIRQSSLNWRFTRVIRWDQDRDDMVLEE